MLTSQLALEERTFPRMHKESWCCRLQSQQKESPQVRHLAGMGGAGKNFSVQRTVYLNMFSGGELVCVCLGILIHCATLSHWAIVRLVLEDPCLSRGKCNSVLMALF